MHGGTRPCTLLGHRRWQVAALIAALGIGPILVGCQPTPGSVQPTRTTMPAVGPVAVASATASSWKLTRVALPTTESRDLDALLYEGDGVGTALAVAGERAYLGQRYFLHLLDVRDPRRPRSVGVEQALIEPSLAAWPSIVDIDARGSLVTLALGGGGLSILDVVADRFGRLFPAPLGAGDAYPGEGAEPVHRLALHDGRVYGAGDGLLVFDVSDPTNARLVKNLPLESPALDIAVLEDKLYILARSDLVVYALDDPDQPRRVANLPLVGGGVPTAGWLVPVAPDQPMVVVTSGVAEPQGAGTDSGRPAGATLWLVDVAEPAPLAVLGMLPIGEGVEGVAVNADANRAYIALDAGSRLSSWIGAYYLGDPVAPRPLGVAAYLDDDVGGLGAKGSTVLVATANRGLKVLDFADPAHPTWLPQPSAEATERPILAMTPVPRPSPITAAEVVLVDSWSPDGRWLAFFAGERDGTLHLLDVATDQVCRHDEVKTYMYEHGEPLGWLADGSVVADALIGRPCAGAFQPRDPTRQPRPTALPGAGDLSPDGRLRARTQVLSEKQVGDIAECETQLVDAASGAVAASTKWDSLVEMFACYDGDWLPDGRYLIGSAVGDGPLLLSADGTTAQVADALLNLPEGSAPDSLIVRLHRGPSPSEWHLEAADEDGGECWLYHPETDAKEPLTCGWSASDGPAGWLVRDELARPLDPPGSPFEVIAAANDLRGRSVGDSPLLAWSRDGRRLAVAGRLPSGAGEVRVAAFPSGEVTARWSLSAGNQVVWSPDSRHVAVVSPQSGGGLNTVVVLDAGTP